MPIYYHIFLTIQGGVIIRKDMRYIYLLNRFNLKEETPEIEKRLRKVSALFKRDYEICISDTVEELRETMKRFKDTEYIITTVGGDGSINLLLNDLIGTDNILSFVPHGTGNDFCRYCMEEMSDGIHAVDLIKINGRYFINVACFGIDADIANDDRFIHNPLIPKSMRYNAGVVYYFLTYRPKKMEVRINGERIEGSFTTLIAANARYYGGGYRPSPNSFIDDGKMEVLLVDELNKISMAKTILSMKDASHLKNPAVRVFETDELVLSSDTKIGANIDGEPLFDDHFELKLVPKGFRIHFEKAFLEEMMKK